MSCGRNCFPLLIAVSGGLESASWVLQKSQWLSVKFKILRTYGHRGASCMPEAAWPCHHAILLWLMRASRTQAHSDSFQSCTGPALWHCVGPSTYNPTAQSLPNWKSSQHASGSCRQASYSTETKSQKTQLKKKKEWRTWGLTWMSCVTEAGTRQELPRGSVSRSEALSLLNLSFSKRVSHSHSIIHIFIAEVLYKILMS